MAEILFACIEQFVWYRGSAVTVRFSEHGEIVACSCFLHLHDNY